MNKKLTFNKETLCDYSSVNRNQVYKNCITKRINMVDINEVATRLKNYNDVVNMKDFNRHCSNKEDFKFAFSMLKLQDGFYIKTIIFFEFLVLIQIFKFIL